MCSRATSWSSCRNADDVAKLNSLKAQAELARITYERDQRQLQAQAVSKQVVDADEQTLKSDLAQVAQQQATLDYKSIRAPFAGRARHPPGRCRAVSRARHGDRHAAGARSDLRRLHPAAAGIATDRRRPEGDRPGRYLSRAEFRRHDRRDQFEGRHRDAQRAGPRDDRQSRSSPAARHVRDRRRSMSARTQSYVTLPQTAVTYNPYGSTVYLVDDKGKDAQRPADLLVAQPGLRHDRRYARRSGRGDSKASRPATRSSPPARSSCTTARRCISTTRAAERRRQSAAQPSIEETVVMNFTDLFIRRPVLATVVSLMILVLGLRALAVLPVLQFPRTENAVVTVTTTYYGADPDVVAGFITTPLENAIAQADGIDYMTSTSQIERQHDHGQSSPQLRSRQGDDRDHLEGELGAQPAAAGRAAAGADRSRSARPSTPCISASRATCSAQNQITDYLVRVVQPKLQAVEGVQTAEIVGGQNFALRAWLDPQTAWRRSASPRRMSRQALAGQQLHLRPRANQGPDGAGQSHRLDRSALARCVPQSGGQAGEWRESSGCRTSPTSRSAPTTTIRASPSTARTRSISAFRSRRRPISSASSRACTRRCPKSARSCRKGCRPRSSTIPPIS